MGWGLALWTEELASSAGSYGGGTSALGPREIAVADGNKGVEGVEASTASTGGLGVSGGATSVLTSDKASDGVSGPVDDRGSAL